MVSIFLGILAHKGGQRQKYRTYPKLNLQTLLQRITGVLMILFTALHVAGAAGFMTPPPAVHAIVPPLFFAMVLAHVAVAGLCSSAALSCQSVCPMEIETITSILRMNRT